MTSTLAFRHNRSNVATLSPGRISALIICWTRIQAALWSVRAFHSAVDMFFASALEDATTSMEGESGETRNPRCTAEVNGQPVHLLNGDEGDEGDEGDDGDEDDERR